MKVDFSVIYCVVRILIVLCPIFLLAQEHAVSREQRENIVRYMDFLGEPKSLEEVILVLSQRNASDQESLTKYFRLLDENAAATISLLRSQLESDLYDFIAPGKIYLIVRQINQHRDALGQKEITEIAELVIEKSKPHGARGIHSLNGFDHPLIEEHLATFIGDENVQREQAARWALASIKKNGVSEPSVKTNEETESESERAIEQIIPESIENPSHIELYPNGPSYDVEQKSPNRLLWLLGALALLTVVGILLRYRKNAS